MLIPAFRQFIRFQPVNLYIYIYINILQCHIYLFTYVRSVQPTPRILHGEICAYRNLETTYITPFAQTLTS
jgi:hypothetical protein